MTCNTKKTTSLPTYHLSTRSPSCCLVSKKDRRTCITESFLFSCVQKRQAHLHNGVFSINALFFALFSINALSFALVSSAPVFSINTLCFALMSSAGPPNKSHWQRPPNKSHWQRKPHVLSGFRDNGSVNERFFCWKGSRFWPLVQPAIHF